MSKKILHISKYYYPYAGGVEDVCYNIVKLLQQEQGAEQKVFCFNDCDQTIDDTYEGVSIKRVAIKRVIASQPLSLCYKNELKKVISEFQPQYVHFHAPNPLAAYYLLKLLPKSTKLIVHWHSDIVAQKLIYSIIKPIEKRLLKLSDIVIATSPNYIEFSPALKPFKDKTIVIQNIIEPQKFVVDENLQTKIESIKESYNRKPIVLFVGRHVPYKGLQYLVEAAKLIKSDCAIIIGGKGRLTAKLKEQAKGLNNIHFVGRIDDEMLAAHYYAADIFAFPSITRNEAFGVVLAEAMYCGAVPVTFTIEGSGVNWVNLNGVTGLECENSNSIKFAQAIDRLLTDKELIKQISDNARQRADELFVIDRISKQIFDLYVQ